MSSPAPPAVNRVDVMDPARASAFAATLGRADPGDGPLPPFWHWLYHWDARPPERLGRDGHPAVGDALIPDMGLPRRMWAGGALEVRGPLRTGKPATKASRQLSAERKAGRTGPLALVTLEHEVAQDGAVVLRERQDLVYRAAPSPDDPLPAVRMAERAPVEEARVFDEVALFRASALTFNGHRIHYDRLYATEVEGHAGVVVHGPLLAEAMADLAARAGPVRRMSYRLTAPAVAGEALTVCRDGARLWMRGADGRLCAEGAWG
ncbi:acyl dehydratase [Jannaschia sp. Os4]|uniref:acyl dehydratase n=1 Tax=Jannaschia sp. Os4 TaxID=2807617 RepID=UPI0019397173|nr:acyl dehydratase [Jannaschia sp. Os4]MBM2576181.1 acyl dehydratase [Jannaschia sp. Os4]